MDRAVPETSAVKPPFGAVHVVHPEAEHTHTAILLHGRGSSGEEFADELFESNLSGGRSLREALPRWKWVFPTSRDLWSTTFQEPVPAWFEAHSLTNTTARQDLQVDGIKDSVSHVSEIVEGEIQLLGGKAQNVVFGGISQGGAVALWTLLCGRPAHVGELGAFVGASTWLPFAENIQRHFSEKSELHTQPPAPDSFVEAMMAPRHGGASGMDSSDVRSTPVFMGHGTDDAYVDVELGREAVGVLSAAGFRVYWKEYTGAEQEGHWLKVPEEVDDIHGFLLRAFNGNC